MIKKEEEWTTTSLKDVEVTMSVVLVEILRSCHIDTSFSFLGRLFFGILLILFVNPSLVINGPTISFDMIGVGTAWIFPLLHLLGNDYSTYLLPSIFF